MHLVGTTMGLGPLGLRARMCSSEGDRHTESLAPLGMMGGGGGGEAEFHCVVHANLKLVANFLPEHLEC